MTLADDRWWRDFDAVVLNGVAPRSRVLDVGCGDGGLVHRLEASGLDALGVDPDARAHPRLIRTKVEDFSPLDKFDAICAVMALHHAELRSVLAAIRRLLRPGGRVFVYDFAWERFDESAAAWLAAHDPSDADNSVSAWHLEHRHLHTGSKIRSALGDFFGGCSETQRPYLARMLGNHALEREEETMIAQGELVALGTWYDAGMR